MRAEKLGEKARRKGMDWADMREVLKKVREELDEAEAALAQGDHEAVASEIGDMMLALANAPRFIGHNAEETLRRACDKFVGRFEAVERLASSRNLDLKQMSPADLEALVAGSETPIERRQMRTPLHRCARAYGLVSADAPRNMRNAVQSGPTDRAYSGDLPESSD